MTKIIKILLFISTLIFFCNLNAQTVSQAPDKIKNGGYKLNNNFDFSVASNAKQQAIALSWVHFYNLTKKHRFKIGYGIRFTGQFGNGLNYVTAPAKLTSKETGPQVLFTEVYPENIDTVYFSKTQHNALNLSINLQYTIKNKIDIGFNIDALGLSFGPKSSGKYMAYQSSNNHTIQQAAPTSYNLLLVSDNDIGMLNSELYGRYWFNGKWAIKFGASFLFTEYTTANKLRLDNTRFRNKSLMGMIGITFNPFN